MELTPVQIYFLFFGDHLLFIEFNNRVWGQQFLHSEAGTIQPRSHIGHGLPKTFGTFRESSRWLVPSGTLKSSDSVFFSDSVIQTGWLLCNIYNLTSLLILKLSLKFKNMVLPQLHFVLPLLFVAHKITTEETFLCTL